MRDLINILESVGLANRKPGEEFRNDDGNLLTFQSLEFYPEKGNFGDTAGLDAGLKTVFDSYGIAPNEVTWTNGYNKSMLAFGIAYFTDSQGQDYYFGRWFKDISPNRQANNFPNNAIPGNYKFQSGVGKKESTGYKPSEVLTQFQNNTPETIYQQIVAKFGQGSAEAGAVQAFMAAKTFPVTFPKGNINFSAFRDYFCEMLQPMALVMNKPVAGNAAEAAEIFFGSGYEDATISFNTGAIGGLYDSLLVSPEGKQIKLSSKGKDGASASVVNLLKSVDELNATPQGQKLLKKHAEIINILRTIERAGYKKAPLLLAVDLGILTANEATKIAELQQLGTGEEVPKNMMDAKLRKMYTERSAKDPSKVVPFLHMLTIIAFKVADKLNSEPRFGQAAAEILNNAALVQMYTEAKDGKDTITLTGFRAVYPSKTVTGVELDPSKTYYSTGNKGNFTFKILKDGASTDDADLPAPAEPAAPAAIGTSDLDAVTNKQRLVGPGVRAARTKSEPNMSANALGRERRKR